MRMWSVVRLTTRVIVTGSRYYRDPKLITQKLRESYFYAVRNGGLPLVVVQGGAPGADFFARKWSEEMEREGYWVRTETHTADWKANGKFAGPKRNMEMVDAGADYVMAFFEPSAANKGTHHCADYAKSKGLRVIKYT